MILLMMVNRANFPESVGASGEMGRLNLCLFWVSVEARYLCIRIEGIIHGLMKMKMKHIMFDIN